VEIVIPAPSFILWVVIGLDVVVIASVLLKKGSLVRRLSALAVVAVVSVFLLVFLYRPIRLSVTDDAMVDATYFRSITVPWGDVTSAFLVPGFVESEYRPSFKVNGNSIPGLKTGWFKLANGRTARVLIQESPDALVLETNDTLWVLAPDRLDELVVALRERGVEVRE